MALLVNIEGIDGSGKGTQAQRLLEHLREVGYRADLVSFPRYQATTFGKKVADFLNGRFGQLHEVNPFLAALLYAGDRFESKGWLQAKIDAHDVVILDRYVPSNMAHQASKVTGAERAELIDWLTEIEFGIYGLPRPHLCLLLDLPAATAKELITRKAPRDYTQQTADLQEADSSHLTRAREVYLELARTQPNWQTVLCVKDGVLRNMDDIAREIWDSVRPLLPTLTRSTVAS